MGRLVGVGLSIWHGRWWIQMSRARQSAFPLSLSLMQSETRVPSVAVSVAHERPQQNSRSLAYHNQRSQMSASNRRKETEEGSRVEVLREKYGFATNSATQIPEDDIREF